jgi:hypothetical protein
VTAEGRVRSPSWWLIVDGESGFLEVLALKLGGGEEVLAVFGFEEEAELFLRLGAGGDGPPSRRGWVARETGAGELASLLLGPLSGVGGVVLDPLPGWLGGSLVGLPSIRRQDFVARLLIGRRRPPAP